MTIKDLRILVDNLDEYIHVPGGIERLRKTILHLAVSGKLVPQDLSEGTGEDLYKQIQFEKQKLVARGKIKKQKPLPAIDEEEIPFEIPESWKWVRVSDLGHSLGQKKPINRFYYIDVASIDNLKQRLRAPSCMEANDAPSRARKIVAKDTVIYSTVRPYLLNTTVIQEDFDKELIASTAFAVLHPFTGINPYWILRNLTSHYFTNYTDKKSVGAAYPAINDAQFSLAVVPLPPSSEQLRIVRRVEIIYELIDKLAERYQSEQEERAKLVNASLSKLAKNQNHLALDMLRDIIKTKEDVAELRKTILHLAVSGKLVPQDLSEGTGEDLYKQIQFEKQKLVARGKIKKQKPLPAIDEEEIPFEIPESWKWVRLGTVGQFGSGSTPRRGVAGYYDGGINWYKSGELTDHLMSNESEEKITEKALRECSLRLNQPGDILIAMYGATAGKVGLLETVGATNQAVCGITPYGHIERVFIYYWLLATREDLISKSSGAAQPNISKIKIVNHLVALPPRAEQERTVNKATELLDLVSKLESIVNI